MFASSTLATHKNPGVDVQANSPETPVRLDETESEYEEIDPSTEEGLTTWLQLAEEAYTDAGKLAATEFGVSKPDNLQELQTLFREFQELVEECKFDVLQAGLTISDEKLGRMQELYDELMQLRDSLVSDYENSTDATDEDEDEELDVGQETERTLGEMRGDMRIQSDSDEESVRNLAINVSLEATENIAEENDAAGFIAHPGLSEDERSALGQVEHNDPINDVADESVKQPGYTEEEIESFINREVQKIEIDTLDSLERILGVNYNRAFDYISDMTVGQVKQLAESDDVRQKMEAANVKYETFLVWMDKLPELEAVVGENDKRLFGELFGRYILR